MGQAGCVIQIKSKPSVNYSRVSWFFGAGLESPIVFLVGLKELFELEQSLRLSDSEREALVRDHGPQALYGRHPGRAAAGHTLCG
jgi:hypothetical protein